jgi:hypothetical protein
LSGGNKHSIIVVIENLEPPGCPESDVGGQGSAVGKAEEFAEANSYKDSDNRAADG